MTGPALRVGDRVELVVPRPVSRGGIIPLRPGDLGVIRAVGGARYAVDFQGVVVVVGHLEVVRQGTVHRPGVGT